MKEPTVKDWTMARLDREARKLARRTGELGGARAALIALRGHPAR